MTITEGRVAGGRSRFGCGSALPEIDVHVRQDARLVGRSHWLLVTHVVKLVRTGGALISYGGVAVPFSRALWPVALPGVN